MANLITLSRIVLLIVVVAIAYWGSYWWQIVNVALLIFVFVTDGLDGYVARKRGESSQLGAMLDIAGDRIVELSLWIVLSNLYYAFGDHALVPIWVPIVFVMRGVLVDTIRATQVSAGDQAPFDVLQSRWGKWLVKSKFMRIFYAVLKAHAFCWLLLIRAISFGWPEFWTVYGPALQLIGAILVYSSVIICIARAIPVLVEFLAQVAHVKSQKPD